MEYDDGPYQEFLYLSSNQSDASLTHSGGVMYLYNGLSLSDCENALRIATTAVKNGRTVYSDSEGDTFGGESDAAIAAENALLAYLTNQLEILRGMCN